MNIHNLEAEQGLLGALMFDSSVYPTVGHVKPYHFFEPLHQRLYDAMVADIDKGGLASLPVIFPQFSADKTLSELGGVKYLNGLLERAYMPIAKNCADMIIDAWAKRSVMEVCQHATSISTSGKPAIEAISYLRRSLETLEASASLSEAEFLHADEVADASVKAMREAVSKGRTLGKLTGLRCIDYKLGGLQPGDLIVIGGRPSMGKSAIARALAHGCAEKNPDDQVLFLGIEMGPNEMIHRELSALSAQKGTGVEYRDMKQAKLSHLDLDVIESVKGDVPRNLILQDVPNLTIEDVRRSIWSRRQKGPVAAVFIDYLQIMTRPESNGRNDSAVIGQITKGLKQIARQANCTIVLLSQLSRQTENRDDCRPQLSDLRESGSIEQDADVVLFPYREAYYLERQTPKKGKELEHDMRVSDLTDVMEVICAKARSSSIGSTVQSYQAKYDLITDKR